ncbi:MAG TPA: hypothetical protein VGM12_30020 [Trebonia sp.]|jgi:hypothetical protein
MMTTLVSATGQAMIGGSTMSAASMMITIIVIAEVLAALIVPLYLAMRGPWPMRKAPAGA